MDTSTVLSTSGYQYTNNVLDFFPHTSAALSAGAEGYVKAVLNSEGTSNDYVFRYVFNYTDHLGNIRLKYAQDPSNNNEISILEEDHYYPYGLKHKGYNTAHKIFKGIEGPGTGVILTPVNPFLGDSYKYKFGGKEYQDDLDINTYDFGARNYDPALGRWMNIDPLAEQMRRHSPYNYAFNNPIFFIDPDGMSPIPMAVTSLGMGIDGVKDIGGMGGNSNGSESTGSRSGIGEGEAAKDLTRPTDDSTNNGTGTNNNVPTDGDPTIIATKFVNEQGETIIDIDDGSNQVYVINDRTIEEFLKNLRDNIENGKGFIKRENDRLGLRWGNPIEDLFGRTYEDPFMVSAGYSCGYGNIGSCGNQLGASGRERAWFNLGEKLGKKDLKSGNMNKNNPTVKNGPALYSVWTSPLIYTSVNQTLNKN